MAFQGVILYRVQSFLSPQIYLKFRHLSNGDTIPGVYDCKSDPQDPGQDQKDCSIDYAVLQKMYCAAVLCAVLIKYQFLGGGGGGEFSLKHKVGGELAQWSKLKTTNYLV